MQDPATGWHTLTRAATAEALGVAPTGLSSHEAAERLARHGPNRLDPPKPTPRWVILLRQFQSPLISILVAAAVLALVLGERDDAVFIAAVLLINAAIGYYNEAKAEREVLALARLIRARARVRRDGHAREVDGEEVVPGDLLLLESGVRVSADVRLVEVQGFRVDESLLTGESTPVAKQDQELLPEATVLADRRNMVYAGTVVVSGRASGLVVATGRRTEVGAIATGLAAIDTASPPLIVAMHRFARVIGWVAIGLMGVVVLVGLAWGQPLGEILLGAVALAVSAIPEGLPIALTVALAVAVSRMAKRGVVVRHLPAVEALGSCGVIATDKTGTLTRNELTIERIAAGADWVDVTGTGYAPDGALERDGAPVDAERDRRLFRLLRAGCLANEGTLVRASDVPEGWGWWGDPTDVALLSAAVKAGLEPAAILAGHAARAAIPFEPEHRYAASFHARAGGGLVCVKGAPERVLDMCAHEPDAAGTGTVSLDRDRIQEAVDRLMRDGYRVIALADAETPEPVPEGATPPEPSGLVFLGLVGMTDPPRDGVPEAVQRCREAGIRVVMITGDHATTAAVIAERIGLAKAGAAVLKGEEVTRMDDAALAAAVDRYAIVARATPEEKLRLVRAWQARGAYVAVTGDGVNDAPALRQANIGVAMGRSGTDVAREASAIVVTDDNFASIVAGVEEGRVAYANIRKVIYLLISTGAGEVVLVLSALFLGLGFPLSAVQLLWLNLVTNGIQGVALAFEPGEPGVLARPPRPPSERIFNRVMVERALLAAAVMGSIGFGLWALLPSWGYDTIEARNMLVQLFVLFEIFHIGNARSETISLFRLSPFRNPILLAGTSLALGVHLAALHTPLFQRLLGVSPISLTEWAVLAALAAAIVVVMEGHKVVRGGRGR